MFLTLMVVGLVGLVMMAIPALGGHRHLGHVQTHGQVHAHGTSLAHHGTHAHAARVISASYVAPPATGLAPAATSIAARR